MKDAAYHVQSMRSAMVREEVGGIAALESRLFLAALTGLLEQGWTEDQIADEYRRQQASLRSDPTWQKASQKTN